TRSLTKLGSSVQVLSQMFQGIRTVKAFRAEERELENFRQSFDPSFGRFKSIWRPTPGNHEYATDGARGYFDYFGRDAGPSRRGYYSFDIGRWHVVALNSNCAEVSCRFGSAQTRWLRRDLRSNRTKCLAAFWHHPFKSSSLHGANPSVKPLFKEIRKAGAEFVLAGHDHAYERLAPMLESGRRSWRRGVASFVVGTGGKSLYPPNRPARHSRFLLSTKYGALELKLGERGYSWRFVDETGRSYDRGRASCR
ncbi:MAG: metallophosphoesterase, partial [Solirubrobacterales bacterium]